MASSSPVARSKEFVYSMAGYVVITILPLLKPMSDFCGEIEESCLLVCHFYLPMERTDTYRYKNPIGRVSFS
jgi:hypothetical protein